MAVTASILSHDVLQAAKQADLLLGCVDSHGGRLVMNQFAVQYGIPLLDAGTGARIEDGEHMTHAGGQVQFVLPGLGCLECREFIDVRQAAFDLAPPHVPQPEFDHGYGTQEPAPSVVFLNGLVASLQIAESIMLLASAVSGNRDTSVPAIVLYDLLRQSLVPASARGSDTCPTCGPDGVTGLADLSPLQAATTPAEAPAVTLNAYQSDA